MDINQLDEVQLRSLVELLSKSNPDLVRESISRLSTNTDPCTALSIELKQSHESLDPEMCSITFAQLAKIGLEAKQQFGRDNYEKMTMREINEKIIKPVCEITRKPYALSLNPKGLQMNVFCTHCWSENFDEFVQSIKQAYESNIEKPNLWICAFALFQGDQKDIEQQLNKPLSDAPFVRALRKASEFLVVRNTAVDLYSRIWCVCELVFATKYNFVPGKTKVVGPDTFGDYVTSVKNAEAFSQTDKERILQNLLEIHSNYKRIDDIVKEFRTHTLSARKDGKVMSQEQVYDRFVDIMNHSEEKYRKIVPGYIRKAIKGETITTVIFGKKETERTVRYNDQYVVCGQAFETYMIPGKDFIDNYHSNSPTQIKQELLPYKTLRENGFMEYSPKRVVLAHKVTKEDMKWFRSGMDQGYNESDPVRFFTYGEHSLVEEGDFLVITYPISDEVYRIEALIFEHTYELQE